MPLQVPLVPVKEVAEKKKEKVKAKILPKEGAPIKIPVIPLIEAEEIILVKPGKEPSGVRPIIPTGDKCCVGVCTNLNNEIDIIGQAIKIRQEELKIMGIGTARMKTRKQVAVLTTKMSVLKDLRFAFAEKGVCKCIEVPKERKIRSI